MILLCRRRGPLSEGLLGLQGLAAYALGKVAVDLPSLAASCEVLGRISAMDRPSTAIQGRGAKTNPRVPSTRPGRPRSGNVAAVANVSPASITNGAGTSASAGTSQANAGTGPPTLITACVAANPSVENKALLMRPSNAVAIARATNTPTLGLKGGSIYSIPVIVSQTVGDRLIALDASQILVADDGEIEVDVSNNALVQMDSAPTDPTVAATVLVSLFQMNWVGLKITRFISWKRVATTAVRDISGAAYV